MTTQSTSSRDDNRQSGYVMSMVLRLILLFLVLAQIAFLAGRYNKRWDLTGDRLFTLTPSTSMVVSKLETPLIIETYFSEDKSMPARIRPLRQALNDLIDEYEELSNGKIIRKNYDPQSNQGLREKAQRLGIEPQRVAGSGSEKSADRSIAVREIWQGMRLRYGAKKQKVIPFFALRNFPYEYERILTPLIKSLASERQPMIGVIASLMNPDAGVMVDGERIKPQGYAQVMRTFPGYDFKFPKLSQGQLIPEELDKLLVIRPKNLSDRVKYALDQFLMRGGKMIVFADNHEFAVQSNKHIHHHYKVRFDHKKSKLNFVDQMAHYGATITPRVVSDQHPMVMQLFGFMLGGQQYRPLFYPYFLSAQDKDWSKEAKAFATMVSKQNGGTEADEEMVKLFEKTFQPGINKDHDFIATVAKLGVPAFFWPCKVGLSEALPKDVEGQVLMRTSPLGVVEDPLNTAFEPFMNYVDPQGKLKFHQQFAEAYQRRRIGYTPTQVPLMVQLKGRFTSFFADKPIPARPVSQAEINEKEEKADPLAKDKEPKAEPGKQGPDLQGPKAPKKKKWPDDPAKIAKAEKEGLLMVIGDADFIRDDFIRYAHLGPKRGDKLPIVGPAPADAAATLQSGGRNQPAGLARLFFGNLLDWLVEDRDLLDLQSRSAVDRTLIFEPPDETGRESPQAFSQRVMAKTQVIRWINILAPCLLLLAWGFLIYLKRSTEKRAFLRRAGL